jgi:hypothetical protein
VSNLLDADNAVRRHPGSRPRRSAPRSARGLISRRWFARLAKWASLPMRVATVGFSFPKNQLVAAILLPYLLARIVLLVVGALLSLAGFGLLLATAAIFYLPIVIVASATTAATLEAGTDLPDDLLSLAVEPAAMPGPPDGLAGCAPVLLRTLHEAFSSTSSDHLKAVTTDGLWRAQRMLLSIRKAQGVGRTWEGDVLDTRVLGRAVHGPVEVAAVELHVIGRCFEQLQESRTVLRGSLENREWTEVLELRRSSSQADAESNIASSDECANCGAALALSAAGSCKTCGALVAARPDQWVISDHRTGAW